MTKTLCAKCDGSHPTDECEHAFLPFEEAVTYLKSRGDVHTFMNPRNSLLVGADWSRREILAAMKAAKRIEVTGPAAQGMKHGLAIEHDGELLYIETERRTDEPSPSRLPLENLK